MSPETKRTYRKLAQHFRRVWMYHDDYTPHSVSQALIRSASYYRPNYFRRLRDALALEIAENQGGDAAKVVRATRNPVTAPGSELPKLPKVPRLKSLSADDLYALLDRLKDEGHPDEFYALSIVYFTGARPCELRNITISDGLVHIQGAKHSHAGLRGADRTLRFKDPANLTLLADFVARLKESPRSIGAIRSRLREEASALWPRRRLLPTLYTLRHQMGADLKAAGVDPRVAAYIMGHQSVTSLSVYGDRRQGDPRRIAVEPAAPEAVHSVRGSLSGAFRRTLSKLGWRLDPK